MTFTISPWVAWGIAALALLGAWWLLSQIYHAITDVIDWVADWWSNRRQPLSDEDELWAEADEEMAYFDGPSTEFPPERSREELGFTGGQPAIDGRGSRRSIPTGHEGIDGLDGPLTAPVDPAAWFQPIRERRAPWWEAEQRAAYHALGLDYPSGLLAKVREAGQ